MNGVSMNVKNPDLEHLLTPGSSTNNSPKNSKHKAIEKHLFSYISGESSQETKKKSGFSK
jgi:hypothetical protein